MIHFSLEAFNKHREEVRKIKEYYSEKSLDSILENRESLILAHMDMVQRAAKSFPLSEQASGIFTVEDLIQEGYLGLIAAVDNIDPERVRASKNPEFTINSFLYKRIRGAIRRAVDQYRGSIRLSEYRIRKIRDDKENNEELVAMFFNCIFDSLESINDGSTKFEVIIKDKSSEYDVNFVSKYLLGLIEKHLSTNEARVITSMYGLDGDKLKGYEIARELGLNETTMYRELNSLKESGINKLVKNLDPDLVVDFMSS